MSESPKTRAESASAETRPHMPDSLPLRYTEASGDRREPVAKKAQTDPHSGFSWSSHVWLIYSAFFIIDPIQRHSWARWIALAAVYVVFLAIYFGYFAARQLRTRVILVAAMFALGLAYIPFNLSSAGIVVYAAAYLPFVIESVTVFLAVLAAGVATLALEAWLLHLTPWSWGWAVAFGIIVGISNLAVARQKRADSKLRMAHEEIEHLAKVAERERIARDLHDVLGHTLSVIVLKSELAGRLVDRDPKRAALEISDVEQIARRALAEVREAIGGYRSEGLAAEIGRAQRTLDAAGVMLRCDSKPPQLPPAEETVLSLILREAVTNIVRHANASRCDLQFSEADGQLSVVVCDDGRGGVRTEGNGLRGMRERVEALGGRFSVDAQGGTRLLIQLPAGPVPIALSAPLGVEQPALSTGEAAIS